MIKIEPADLTDVDVPEGEWYTSGIAWFKNDDTRQLAWFKNGLRDPKMDYSPSNFVPDSPMHVYLYAASYPSLENTGYMAVDYAFVRKFVETEPTVAVDPSVQTKSGSNNSTENASKNSSEEVSESETPSEPESKHKAASAGPETRSSEPEVTEETMQAQENLSKEQAINSNNTSYPEYTVSTSGIRLSSPYQYDFSTLAKELDSSNINTIFLTVNGKDVWQYERFVKMAHEDRISVHAIILEDINCTEQGDLNACEETLNTVINYNKKSLAPFDGIEIYVQFSDK